MYPIEPEALSIPESRLGVVPKNRKPPRHKQGERFLKGPIPWSWLAVAANLPGHALHVGIALWFLAGIKKKRTVELSGALLEELGVERRTGYRAMEALEKAGLISAVRHVGRSPLITILESGTDNGPNSYSSVVRPETSYSEHLKS